MIPYELIIPSASRPHLLRLTLRGLMARVDWWPERVILHDDAVFPGRQEEVATVLREEVPREIPTIFLSDNPPIMHGPSLQKLLAMVSTPYVLYSQDDHQAVRPIPIERALTVLDRYHLNQIRFNKRDTMDKKGREGAEFHKVEFRFAVWHSDACDFINQVQAECICGIGHEARDARLCAADHWYFQTGVWRVAAIKPVVDWWAGPGGEHGAFSEHMEVKINQMFNGQWRGKHPEFPPEVPILTPEQGAWNDPQVRARVHKTFIWGPVGEPAFVQHLGADPKDWALIRGNRDQPGTKGA